MNLPLHHHFVARRIVSVLMLASLLSVIPTPQPLPTTKQADAAGAIWCVDHNGGVTIAPCANDVAFTTIQAAVDIAQSGDIIRIANGIYTPDAAVEASNVITISSKSLLLQGGFESGDWTNSYTSSGTIIDGQGIRVGVGISEASVGIADMIIKNGQGGISAYFNGGNTLHLTDVSVIDNQIMGSGGGIFAVGGPTIMIRTKLHNNSASEDGGGFYGLHLDMVDSEIATNRAGRSAGGAHTDTGTFNRVRVADNIAKTGDGGGLHISTSALLTDTQVLNNQAGEFGGGLYQNLFGPPEHGITVTGGIFDGNRAEQFPEDDTSRNSRGGAMAVGGKVTLINVQVVNNTARYDGGGLFQRDLTADVQIHKTLFERNRALLGSGGGLSIGGSAVVDDVEVRDNQAKQNGGGFEQYEPSNGRPAGAFVSVVNSTFERNEAQEGSGGGLAVARDGILSHVYTHRSRK